MTLGLFRNTFSTMASLTFACHLATVSLSAAPFAVTSYATGGGGISSQGAFVLKGTIGQPAAAVLSGGDYEIAGGFWPRFSASSTIEVPRLLILWIDGGLQISWTPAVPGFRLQQADDLTMPVWTDAPPGNPVRIPPPRAAVFYRLTRP